MKEINIRIVPPSILLSIRFTYSRVKVGVHSSLVVLYFDVVFRLFCLHFRCFLCAMVTVAVVVLFILCYAFRLSCEYSFSKGKTLPLLSTISCYNVLVKEKIEEREIR